jgi:hypothetical protein
MERINKAIFQVVPGCFPLQPLAMKGNLKESTALLSAAKESDKDCRNL